MLVSLYSGFEQWAFSSGNMLEEIGASFSHPFYVGRYE